MRAVVLTGYGNTDKLELQDLPTPKPGPGEVLVRVKATSINPIDHKIRRGYRNLPLPEVLGRDVAGEVSELGANVTGFKVGDRVMGLVQHAYADFLVAKAEDLVLIPQGLSNDTAAALPLVSLTGSQLIEEQARPKPGELILITGALGGVGRAAVYAARKIGARVLVGVRKEQKQEAETLGAEGIVAIDDDAEIAQLPPLDAIADTVGGETITKLLGRLKKGGRLATVVGEPEAAKSRGIEVRAFMAHPDSALLRRLADAAANGELKIPIAKRLKLSEVREASRLEEEGGHGKIVMLLS